MFQEFKSIHTFEVGDLEVSDGGSTKKKFAMNNEVPRFLFFKHSTELRFKTFASIALAKLFEICYNRGKKFKITTLA